MHIDELIHRLKKLQSEHEVIHIYTVDTEYGWGEPLVELVKRSETSPYFNCPPEEQWVGIYWT